MQQRSTEEDVKHPHLPYLCHTVFYKVIRSLLFTDFKFQTQTLLLKEQCNIFEVTTEALSVFSLKQIQDKSKAA